MLCPVSYLGAWGNKYGNRNKYLQQGIDGEFGMLAVCVCPKQDLSAILALLEIRYVLNPEEETGRRLDCLFYDTFCTLRNLPAREYALSRGGQ